MKQLGFHLDILGTISLLTLLGSVLQSCDLSCDDLWSMTIPSVHQELWLTAFQEVVGQR